MAAHSWPTTPPNASGKIQFDSPFETMDHSNLIFLICIGSALEVRIGNYRDVEMIGRLHRFVETTPHSQQSLGGHNYGDAMCQIVAEN